MYKCEIYYYLEFGLIFDLLNKMIKSRSKLTNNVHSQPNNYCVELTTFLFYSYKNIILYR